MAESIGGVGTRKYKATSEEDSHGRAEQLQWARILSSGDVARGMVLLFVQKLCTAFHEFEPAWRAGALHRRSLPFCRERLAQRINTVLIVMKQNDLDTLTGFKALERLLHATETARTMDELANLCEDIHSVNHVICDSLEVE
jgi:hypothetical protein